MKKKFNSSLERDALIVNEKERIADIIQNEMGDNVIKFRRDLMTQKDIAIILKSECPQLFEKNSVETIRSGVSLFLSKVLTEQEREEIRKNTHAMANASDEEKLAFSQMWNAAQTKEDQKAHGKSLAESQGKIPFSDEEKKRIAELSLEYTNIYRGNSIPNYKIIAQILNKEFHWGKEVRNWRLLQKWMNTPKRKAEFETFKQKVQEQKQEKNSDS